MALESVSFHLFSDPFGPSFYEIEAFRYLGNGNPLTVSSVHTLSLLLLLLSFFINSRDYETKYHTLHRHLKWGQGFSVGYREYQNLDCTKLADGLLR